MSEHKPIKKVLILGATGRTGVHIVQYALSKGYEVVALVRRPENFKHSNPKVTVVRGDTENPSDVEKAVSMADEVISVINNPRASESPWAKVLGRPFMIRDSIKNVVRSMKNQGKKRILVMSTFGAGESFDHLPWFVRLLVKYSNMKVAFADHTGQEEVLKASDLDWTVVRCVQLSNEERLDPLIVSSNNTPKPANLVSRKQAALFLVEQLDRSEYLRKLPVISEASGTRLG
jgi:uncharacterized protein YbjT (DUF2867 family)